MHHESDKLYRLDGKVALVTGAARGIGLAAAELLAQGGAKVMLTDVLAAEGKAAAAELSHKGLDVVFQNHDVADENAWVFCVERIVKEFGGFDVLVNNAGIHLERRITDTRAEDLRRILAVNVEGVYFGIKQAFLAMRPGGAAGRGGSIINLSSAAGLVGGPGCESAYSASKGAVRLVTKAAAIEAGQLGYGIRVNSVHPGFIGTTRMAERFFASVADLFFEGNREKAVEYCRGLTPAGNIGNPLDIAAAVLFLSSDASRFITGTEFTVDGGFTAV